MGLSNNELKAVLVDRSGKASSYLHQYMEHSAYRYTEAYKLLAPSLEKAPPYEDTLLERWNLNLPDSKWSTNVAQYQRQTDNPSLPSHRTVTRWWVPDKFLRTLLEENKKLLSIGKKINEAEILEQIKQYQLLLMIEKTNIFWVPLKPPLTSKQWPLQKDYMWGPDKIKKMLSSAVDWGVVSNSRSKLRRSIGNDALKAVEDLTFLKKGTKKLYGAAQVPNADIKGKTKTSGGGLSKGGGRSAPAKTTITGPYQRTQSAQFEMAQYDISVPANPTLFKDINDSQWGPTQDVTYDGKLYSYLVELDVDPDGKHKGKNSIEAFLKEGLNLKPQFTARQILDVILTRWLIKLKAMTAEALVDIAAEDSDVTVSYEEAQNAIAQATNRNREQEEVNVEALLAKARNAQQFNAQCFLLQQIRPLAQQNRRRLNETVTAIDNIYKDVRLVNTSENPMATLNLLSLGKGNQAGLLDLRSSDLSQLMPHLRIYKVLYDHLGRQQSEAEFKFPNATSISATSRRMDMNILEPLENPLYQEYGVKSFSWKFIGSDPFSYANDIESTLVVYFQDFEQLSVERKTSDGARYRLLDLLVPSGEDPKKPNKNKDNNFFYDLRVDVGLQGPETLRGFSPRTSIRSLYLAMVDYDISFAQEGFFELSINYKSRLEQTLYDRRTNILGKTGGVTLADIKIAEADLKDIREDPTSSQDAVKEAEKVLADIRLETTQDTLSSINQHLINKRVLYRVDVSKSILERTTPTTDKQGNPNYIFNKASTPHVTTIVSQAPQTTSYTSMQTVLDLAEVPSDPDKGPSAKDFLPPRVGKKYNIGYVYLIDLVEAASSLAFNNAQKVASSSSRALSSFLENTRVVMTDFSLYDPILLGKTDEILTINIGDLPIHVDLFAKFYYEKVIKYNVTSYPLMKFIRDVAAYCVLNIMDTCFPNDKPLRSSLRTGFLSFQKKSKDDPFTVAAEASNKKGNVKLGKFPIEPLKPYSKDHALRKIYLDLSKDSENLPKIASKTSQRNAIHTLIMSSTSFNPSFFKITDIKDKKKKDQEKGIYHLSVGSAKGIVKNISFSKTDAAFLQQQRFTTQDTFGILSNVFEATIDLYGNTLFYPGMRIYLDLGERFSSLKKPYVANSFANIMGLGGYHIITEVSSEISEGKFETKIQARWESSGTGEDQ